MSTSASCLASVISSYSSDIDMEEADGSMLCYIQNNNTFEIDDLDLLQLMKNECGTDAECNNDLADCFSRLDDFQNSYEISLTGVLLQNITSTTTDYICSLDSEEFDQGVRNKIFEVYPDEDALFNYLFLVNDDLNNLNQEFSTAPVWLWPIIQEIGAEMIISIIEKQLKLTLADDVKDLIRAIGQQDLVGFVKEAIDITATFHPAVKLLDAIWDTSTFAKKAYLLIGKIKGMATSLGEEVVENIWSAFNLNGRSILKDLDVSDWPLVYASRIQQLTQSGTALKHHLTLHRQYLQMGM